MRKSTPIACTADALDKLRPMNGHVSCWLHFDDRARVDVHSIALKLVKLNCCHFAISGSRAEPIHDEIDDVVIDHGKDLILTTWHTGPLSQTAGEFLAVTCADCDDPIRLATVFSESDATALATLSRMVELLRAELE